MRRNSGFTRRGIIRRFIALWMGVLVISLLLSASIIFVRGLLHPRLNLLAQGVSPLTFEAVEEMTLWYNQVEAPIGNLVSSNDLPQKTAYLTFDDGPSANTERLLAILREHQAPAIFFILGESILNMPNPQELLQAIVDEGHYIGLHTMTHDFNTLYVGEDAPQRFIGEMLELRALIASKVDGFQTNLCRPAFGKVGTFQPGHFTAVEEAGLYCVDWNIDPQDWQQQTPEQIFNEVVSQIENNQFPDEVVILLHEHVDATLEALPWIINYLREQGYVIAPYQAGQRFNFER